MLQICDLGQMALLPLQRKSCCGFFRPTASAGFELTILGTEAAKQLTVTHYQNILVEGMKKTMQI
jgi:hypothetical protein